MNYIGEQIEKILNYYNLDATKDNKMILKNMIEKHLENLVDLDGTVNITTLTGENLTTGYNTGRNYLNLVEKINNKDKVAYCKWNNKIYTGKNVPNEVWKYLMVNNYSPFLFEILNGNYSACIEVASCPELVDTMKYYINNESNILKRKDYINMVDMEINTDTLWWAFNYVRKTKFKNYKVDKNVEDKCNERAIF